MPNDLHFGDLSCYSLALGVVSWKLRHGHLCSIRMPPSCGFCNRTRVFFSAGICASQAVSCSRFFLLFAQYLGKQKVQPVGDMVSVAGCMHWMLANLWTERALDCSGQDLKRFLRTLCINRKHVVVVLSLASCILVSNENHHMLLLVQSLYWLYLYQYIHMTIK